MLTSLPPDTIVTLVKPGHTGGEASPARCLRAGEIIVHNGKRMRVLVVHTITGKATVEPVTTNKEGQ